MLDNDETIKEKYSNSFFPTRFFPSQRETWLKKRYYTSCMFHINIPSVVPILLNLPTVGFCEMVRHFSLILIHIYHWTCRNIVTLQGIHVCGYVLECPIINTRFLRFTQLMRRAQWGFTAARSQFFTWYDRCFYNYIPSFSTIFLIPYDGLSPFHFCMSI